MCLLIAVVATGVVAAVPTRALTTCSFTGGTVAVSIWDPPTAATIVRSGDAIHVNGAQCATADVFNTDLITVNDTTSANLNLILDLSGGPFAPGATDEGGTSSEIEFSYSLGASNSDNLTVKGTTGSDDFVAGADGLNLNAAEPDGIDTDITLAGVDALIFQTDAAADEISGAGGFGAGAPTMLTMLATPGDGDDTYFGGNGRDTYFASGSGDGTDTFVGNAGMDNANYLGRSADLNFTLAGGADDGEAGEGDDIRAADITSGSGNDTIVGDDNDNQLFGFNGDDDLFGMGGNDTFVQGAVGDGIDTISGGAGIDHVMYVNRTAAQPVTVTFDDVANDGATSGEGDNIGSDIENLTGGQGNDVLSGDADDNVIAGFGGNDELSGLGGNDTLDGDAGTDTYDGGPGDDLFHLQEAAPIGETVTGGDGNDTADYEGTSNDVTITLDGIANDGVGGENDNLLVENATGGSGADTITGDAGPNIVSGGSNNDTLNGGGGDDILAGGDGNDIENGEGDNDTFDQGVDADGGDTLNGGNGTDTADYEDRTLGVVVTLDGVANDGTSEADNVGGAGNDVENVIGGSSGDDLTGNGSPNRLDGGPGADTLNGGGGDDVLDGGTEGDTFIGGSDLDTVTYAGRTTGVVASIGDGTNDGTDLDGDGTAEEGDDVQSSVENITGGDGNDQLTGDAGPNALTGGNGDDRLKGGDGPDVESGGPGADTFDQGSTSDGGDVLDGGTEVDLVDFSLRVTRVVAGPGGGADGEDADGNGVADEGDQIAPTVENITGGAKKDRLKGNELANVFRGGAGNDVLVGGAGKDILKGQKGKDKAKGGPGRDKCSAETKVSC